jgi:hypothetical protein
VQVGHVDGENSVHSRVLVHPLHEQVGNPVGGVHVVGAAALVAGVLAQLQELLDVQVPGFQVGADGALALAALVDRHRGVVDHLEEGNDALALPLVPLIRLPRARTGVQSLPRPPAYFCSRAFSLMDW